MPKDFMPFFRDLQDGVTMSYVTSYASTTNKLLAAFNQKTQLLINAGYQELYAVDFVTSLFHDDGDALNSLMVVTSGDDAAGGHTEKGTYTSLTLDEFLVYQSQRSDVYLAPATFIHGCYKLDLVQDLFAFVIDIDDVSPKIMQHIINQNCFGATFITNSGQGCHLYYALKTPVPFYKKNREDLQSIYKRIYSSINNQLMATIDWHSLIQPFRIPGSKTKLDVPARGFECGEMWDIYDLAKSLGLEFSGSVEKNKDYVEAQSDYNEEKDLRKTGSFCPICGCELVIRESKLGEFIGCTGYPKCSYKTDLDGNRIIKGRAKRTRINQSWYDTCFNRVSRETKEGNRYMAMVGLVVVAYKAGISKEQVEEDLRELVAIFNSKGSQVKENEIGKALRAYNRKAIRTPSSTLEQWFGWTFERRGQIIRSATGIDWESLQEEIDNDEKFRQNLESKGLINDDGSVNKRRYSLYRARRKRDANQEERGRIWNQNSGRRTKETLVKEWFALNPEGSVAQCHEATGISLKTIYKWKGETNTKKGRPNKEDIVKSWRDVNPEGTKTQCSKDTGVSLATIRKYW